jgi:hypothetical protein
MRLETLSRKTAHDPQRRLRHLRRERERELLALVIGEQFRERQRILPQEDAHPLLRQKDVRALDFVVFARDGEEALVELALGDGDGLAGLGVDGFVEAAEEGAEVDEVCGDGAVGAVAEGREVGGAVEGCGDFALEGMRSGES